MGLGPRFRLHGDVNFSSAGDGKWAGGEDGQELIGLAPCDTASCDGIEFHSCHMRISSPQDWRRMAPPPHSSLFPPRLLSLANYRSGQSITSFTPKYGIGLQSARDYIASLVAPTGTSDTEVGFCADIKEHMVQGSLADLWSISRPGPTVSIWCNIIPITVNSRYSQHGGHWYSGAYLAPKHL